MQTTYTFVMTHYLPLTDITWQGKRVLVRVDHNIESDANGTLKNDEKIRATLPTIEFLLAHGARVILMTHVGRPKGKVDPTCSTVAVAARLQALLSGVSVAHHEHTVGDDVAEAVRTLAPGHILYLENVRFQQGEEGSPEEQAAFAQQLASLADAYVNEAFPSCHTYEEASTCAVARLLPAYAGFYLQKETSMLGEVLHHPARPVVLVMSGAKMETKVPTIEYFLSKGDAILLGGALANTFLAASGITVGSSKCEQDQFDAAREILGKNGKPGSAVVHLPIDAAAATEPRAAEPILDLPLQEMRDDLAIFDCGTATVERYADVLRTAATIVWNGPLGMYEVEPFHRATLRIAEEVAAATTRGALTIVGGGDTVDFHVRNALPLSRYTFVSTGGGAMLEFLSGQELPALGLLASVQ